MTRKQTRCLNTLLTVNAVLLGGLLWTQLADRPLLAGSAEAQSRMTGTSAAQGVPNAAQQREQMIDALRDMKKSVDEMKKTMEDGKLKVQVTNLDEIKIDVK